MAEISGLTIYPLTGARGIDCEQVGLTPSGLEGDREYMLYRPDDVHYCGHGTRVSQKEFPVLAQVDAVPGPGGLTIQHETNGAITIPATSEGGEVVPVEEFGDMVPLEDMGGHAAGYFSALVGEHVRLGRKPTEWMAGGVITPGKRRNAPLHIISDSAVRAVEAILGSSDDLSPRFRANMRVSGLEADDDELKTGGQLMRWAGQLIVCGPTLVRVERPTLRCKVPSQDQRTGEYLKDVAQAFGKLLAVKDGRSGGRAFGVYGWPVAHPEASPTILKIGQTVDSRA